MTHRVGQAANELQAATQGIIVDEAQDHDTQIRNGTHELGLGWWSWYFALLKEGAKTPMALFYDPAQRPSFRGVENFQPERLLGALGGAVHVRLRKALRFTQPIFNYLKTLRTEETKHLVDTIQAHDKLPTGPEVMQLSASSEKTIEAVEKILNDWKSKGLCRPSDVALIGPRKWLKDTALGGSALLCGYEVADYSEVISGKVAYLGAHRSKGMDFLGVIVIEFTTFKDIKLDDSKQGYQEAFFIGASRARQLLGVVSKKIPK